MSAVSVFTKNRPFARIARTLGVAGIGVAMLGLGACSTVEGAAGGAALGAGIGWVAGSPEAGALIGAAVGGGAGAAYEYFVGRDGKCYVMQNTTQGTGQAPQVTTTERCEGVRSWEGTPSVGPNGNSQYYAGRPDFPAPPPVDNTPRAHSPHTGPSVTYGTPGYARGGTPIITPR